VLGYNGVWVGVKKIANQTICATAQERENNKSLKDIILIYYKFISKSKDNISCCYVPFSGEER